MQYDFETVIRREGVGSAKWDSMTKVNGRLPGDVIPFSGAEMEFVTAPPIAEDLKNAIDTMVLGRTDATEGYVEALCERIKKRHNFTVKPEWALTTRTVLEAVNTAIRAFTEKGEAILVLTPVCGEMAKLLTLSGRPVVESPLLRKGTSYEIDFDDFERKARGGSVRLFVLCNPHNPVARVWKKKELERVGRICLETGIVVVSDEAWSGIIMKGQRHVTFGAVSESFLQNLVVCFSPAATYNLTGLQIANVIIPGGRLRKQFRATYLAMLEHSPRCNILSYVASRSAWEKCDGWLEKALSIIAANKELITDFLGLELPQIKVMDFEGSYFLWLNMKGLGLDYRELERINKTKAHLFFEEGYTFGEQGESFERWNIACPTYYIERALTRMKAAYSRIRPA